MEQPISFLFERYIIFVLAAFLLCTYFVTRRNPKILYHLEKLNGPVALPIVGNLLPYINCQHNDIVPVIATLLKEYGNTFRLWIGNIIPYVFTCDVHVIEKLLSGQKYIEKGKYDYSLLHSWLGTGLLTAPKEKWSVQRKLLAPTFHLKVLQDFIPVFNEHASIFAKCLTRDGRDNGQEFDLYPYIAKCSLDIICETAMGTKIDTQTSISTFSVEYLDAVKGMCALLFDKSNRPWFRVPIIYHLSNMSRLESRYLEILNGFSKMVLQDRKAERKTKSKNMGSDENLEKGESPEGRLKAFLDLLLDVANENPQFTDKDILEEFDTFMFAGHDTTGVNLSWAILLLAMHPECQKKVHKELDELFADDPERDVTLEDISKMKYLECCVKESLRLFPSVPYIMRQIDTYLHLDDGTMIPQGVTAVIAVYHVHRLAEHFPEPEKFLPERWALENVNLTKRHPFSFLAFSAGPRNCIGQKFAMMEEKIVLAKLLRRYGVETKLTLEQVKVVPDVVLRCDNGVNICLRKR